MTERILIVEDDAALNQMLSLHFADQGFEVDGVGNGAAALAGCRAREYALVLLDQQLPDVLGIELLQQIRALHPAQPVIMMTGRHDLELAIDAIKLGAAEFIHKPVRTSALQQLVDKVLVAGRQARDVQAPPASAAPPRELVGKSEPMLAVSKEIALSAASKATVLITGESGTGKEVVARLIHQHSGRRGPFVAINCAAIVDTLLESELFGHEKGAFTGALARKPGRFEQARGGTLFLDEVGELAAPLQAKLLRVLQERTFERVGGHESLETDARLIAATHRDLMAEVAAGRFREDLVYRLQVINIRLPALRERPEDIPLLVPALLEKIATSVDTPRLAVTDDALQRLLQHPWPGNVRELENALTRAAVRARGALITADLFDLGPPAGAGAPNAALAALDEARLLRSLDAVEAEHIQRVLNHTGGHKGNTCRILGISRPALDRKIGKYGLTVP